MSDEPVEPVGPDEPEDKPDPESGGDVPEEPPALRRHEASPECWCGPERDPEEPGVWVHRADGRPAVVH